MKKIMMITMVVALAGATQAATINWGSTAQNIYTADGTALIPVGGGVVQLVYVSGAQNPDGSYATEVVVDSGLVGAASTAPAKGKYNDSYVYTYNTTTVGGQTLNNGDLFIIRVFDAPTVEGAANSWDSGTFKVTATTNAGTDNFYLSSTTKVSGDWDPIPEPATAGLLGIGLAAIALRRRLSKKA
jgi:hypothetical protein